MYYNPMMYGRSFGAHSRFNSRNIYNQRNNRGNIFNLSFNLPFSRFGRMPFRRPQFGMSPYGRMPFGRPQFGRTPFGLSPFGRTPFGLHQYGRSPFGLHQYPGLGSGFPGQRPPLDLLQRAQSVRQRMARLQALQQRVAQHSPPPPPPPPQRSYEPVQQSSEARVWGDPHFVGFDGEKFDVQGKGGNIYSIISDGTVQFNSKFGTPGGDNPNSDVTYNMEVGIQVATQGGNPAKIQFGAKGRGDATFDGQKMDKLSGKVNGQNVKDAKTLMKLVRDKKISVDDIEKAVNSGELKGVKVFTEQGGKKGFVVNDGNSIGVSTAEYDIHVYRNGGYLDQATTLKARDSVKSHGLLGQTDDGVVKHGKTGKGAQGEGAINGVYTDYEVADLFSTTAKTNNNGNADYFRFGRGGGGATTDAGNKGGASEGGVAPGADGGNTQTQGQNVNVVF